MKNNCTILSLAIVAMALTCSTATAQPTTIPVSKPNPFPTTSVVLNTAVDSANNLALMVSGADEQLYAKDMEIEQLIFQLGDLVDQLNAEFCDTSHDDRLNELQDLEQDIQSADSPGADFYIYMLEGYDYAAAGAYVMTNHNDPISATTGYNNANQSFTLAWNEIQVDFNARNALIILINRAITDAEAAIQDYETNGGGCGGGCC